MQLVNRLASLIAERANYFLSVAAFIALIAIVGIGFLRITPDNRVFYGDEYLPYVELKAFEDQFDVNSVIVFAIHSKLPIDESPEFRSSVRWLEANASQIENYVKVTSIASLPHPYIENDALHLGELLEYVCASDCDASREAELQKNGLVGRFISYDMRTVVLYAIVDVDQDLASAVTKTHSSVLDVASHFREKYPDLELMVTGAVPMMQAFVDTAAADSVGVVGIAFLVILIFLCFALRSFVLGVLLFSTGLIASAVALGIAGWTGYLLNTATSVTPLVVFTLVVAGAMHLVVSYTQNFESGNDANDRLEKSLRAQIPPMFLAAVTSTISLLSLLFVTSPPIRELGVLSSIGVGVGFLLSLCFLAPILPKVVDSDAGNAHRFVAKQLNKLLDHVFSNRYLPALTFIAFMLGMLGLTQLRIDDDFIRYFDEEVTFRKDVERMISLGVGSPYHIEVALKGSAGHSAFSPAVMQYSEELTSFLRSQQDVLNVTSINDVIDEIAELLEIPKSQAYSSAEVTNQLYLTYELGLPANGESTAFLNAERSTLRYSILLRDISSHQTQIFESLIYGHHQKYAPVGTSLMVTGENIPVSHLSKKNIEDMVSGLVPVLFLIAGLFALITRRLLIFFIGLVAIFLPIATGFGLWGWMIGDIGLAGSIVLALTVGVVIDDAIHILYRFEDGRKNSRLGPGEAATYAVRKAGPAVIVTSLCLSLGFSLLLLSSYAVNQVFGIVACLIFALALIFDLIVLPKLLASPRAR